MADLSDCVSALNHPGFAGGWFIGVAIVTLGDTSRCIDGTTPTLPQFSPATILFPDVGLKRGILVGTGWKNIAVIWMIGAGCTLQSEEGIGGSMVTNKVLQRAFMISYGQQTASAFALDRKSRQYLVTARHVTEGISETDQIRIVHGGKWKNLDVKVVGVAKDEVDVTVLACDFLLVSPSLQLEPAALGELYLSQQVYFVGFPFGWTTGGEDINREFPLPLVKAGIVSAFPTAGRPLIIDAHNNKGFSGGPVVFVPQGSRSGDFRVAAIVSYYPTPIVMPIVDKTGEPIVDPGSGESIAYFNENPGLLAAYEIKHATDLIDANPIGFPLDKGE